MIITRGPALPALALALTTSAWPAWADFWADAGAAYQGVTLHGVTQSTPPSNHVKDVLAPAFENGGSMNSPEAKAALAYWLHLRDIAPPESAASTWTEVGTTFAAGRAAQGLVYGENAAWIASDPEQSRVVGHVGVALPPVEPGVMEAAEAGNGYIGYQDGGAFGIPVTSKNQDAALLFLQYIGQDSVQADWAVAAPRITNTATYDDPKVAEMDASLGGYYSMLRDQGRLFAGAPSYPVHAQVREATAPIFYRILTGEVGPDEGLDQMAQAAEAELTNLGYRQ